MNNNKKSLKYVLTALVILAFSTFLPTIAYAAPVANSDKDWQYVNANSWGWNYSPETQINKDTVGQLEVKWLFPLEGKSQAALSMRSTVTNEGSTTPPIVVGGKVYVTTNYLRTYAIDAKTGKQAWAHDYVINATDLQRRLPLIINGPMGILQSHLHGIRYWAAGDAILLSGFACDFYGINAKTGMTSFAVQDLCKDIPGNLYKFQQGAVSETNIATYDKGNQFIYVLPGAMHSTIYAGDFRHTTMGIDMTTKQILWRVFSFPPHDVPTKDWATQECDIGYFLTTPCSEVKTKAPQNLEWDWSQPNEKPSIYGGVTANWGQPVIDEDTGILYTQTGNQGPYTYIGATPGPRLYGSTIMAIDVKAGKRIWWLQPFPRDPYDYDCNWGGVLVDSPTLGKVYMKGCKEGRLYTMDAKTGKPLNVIDVVNEQVQWGQITSAALKEPYQGGVRYHLNDPLSTYDMREMVSPDGSKYCGRPCDVYPNFSNGIFGTDMSYDPATNTLFHYAIGLQTKILDSPAPVLGQSVAKTQGNPITNSTIVARDAATGKVNWTYYYNQQQRSHLVITPSLVFTGFTDGQMRFFDKTTGSLLREINLGSDMRVGVTTGQDSSGNQMIFTILGVTMAGRISPTNPGVVVSLGLSAAKTTTVTTTSVTTSSITTTATSTTTAISTTTATTTSVSTATTSVTNTITQPAQTSTLTETVGLPAEVTYGAVGVALVAIVAAAVMMTRKRA